MKTKLTLSIEKSTKEQAKRYAKRHQVSVSQMVEDFLESISKQEEEEWEPPEDSIVGELLGSVSDNDKRPYQEIIEEEILKKHG